jgi:hypothetical protein
VENVLLHDSNELAQGKPEQNRKKAPSANSITTTLGWHVFFLFSFLLPFLLSSHRDRIPHHHYQSCQWFERMNMIGVG